jgi:7,8-didemethyl-8-hydroxy-5-deazariboflavin synthase CofG subunit
MISFVEETDNLFSSEEVYSSFKSHGVEVNTGKPPPGRLEKIFQDAYSLGSINREDALSLVNLKTEEIPYLLIAASKVRDAGKGRTLSFSKNLFLPLTRLCRDRCGYCTFKIEPQEGQLFVPPDEVKEMARKGAQLGCTELLFVTGDKPELAYSVYRDALREIGYKTTAEYLIAMCEAGLRENIFPHSNLGLATRDELAALRESNPSMGLMLENISPRLLKKGQAHYRSADKVPKLRMRTMEMAGELRIAWTSGILVGIRETWEERIDSLYALKRLSDEYGHIQEIIIQNFSPKHGIIMQNYPPPSFMEMLKTVAISRLIFGENMNIQIPPNLNPATYPLFIFAGINDLGGVSPVTIDYVNPEAPWPHIKNMANLCDDVGFKLEERLPVYPEFINEEFISKAVLERIHNFVDKSGFAISQEVGNEAN